MRKRSIMYLICSLMLLSMFSGCKKSANSPSLSSRKPNMSSAAGTQSINGSSSTSSVSKGDASIAYDTGKDVNTEEYMHTKENGLKSAAASPQSTFSIDVDTASYSNMRRFLTENQLPPVDAVRIEELINYFDYEYPNPEKDVPFSITTEVAACPWNSSHYLAMIGLQGRRMDKESLPPSNLVFLLDVSGSMSEPNKLPLVKSAMKLLVNNLTEKDRISIVVYAGAAGTVLEPTPGNNKDKILSAIEKLNAGGSTAGAQGIQLAYSLAKENFIKGGNNRVILATDGDFNVGISSDEELVKLIEEKRKDNIFLSVLGFGEGNFKDSKMEALADKGNGNFAYIDSLEEAKKVLVEEMGSTLMTIAKDVKIQVEFNAAKVKGYRLVGYDNRVLNNQDFTDDTKDAGELGAGHTVTAFYEIIPAGSDEKVGSGDEKVKEVEATNSRSMMTVKLRYKNPDSDESRELSTAVKEEDVTRQPSVNFRFAAAAAEYGMLLKNSEYKGTASFEHVISTASEARGTDLSGYRSEFIRLVQTAQKLQGK
ncbi:MAG: VWA domain-containing protein [Bacillota bacterium]|nr:VWA domain-containing protein [Bacillota bacterium]